MILLLACAPAPSAEPPVDAPCAEGEELQDGVCVPEGCSAWAEVDGDAVYLREGASGEGSFDDPAGDAAAAIDAGATTLVFDAGTYAMNAGWSDRGVEVRLVGRCPARTTLVAADEDAPVLSLEAGLTASMSVEGLTLSGGSAGLSLRGGRAELTDVVVSGVTGVGLDADGSDSTLVLRDVWVRDTYAERGGSLGFGVWVTDRAELTWEGGGIVGAEGFGLAIGDSGTVVTVLDIEVREVGFAGNDETKDGSDGAVCVGQGPDVTLTEVVIGPVYGPGLQVIAASVRIERSTIDGAVLAGVYADEAAALTMDDVVISGTTQATADGSAYGARIRASSLEAHTLTFVANGAVGLALEEASTATLEDVRIERMLSHEAVGAAFGLVVTGGSTATAEALAVGNLFGMGIAVLYEGSSLTATGVDLAWIGDPQAALPTALGNAPSGSALVSPSEILDYSVAFAVDEGGFADVTDLRISHAQGMGVRFDNGSEGVLRDVSIRETDPLTNGLFGRALTVDEGSDVEVEGLTIDGARELGILVSGTGSTLEATSVEVTGVERGVFAQVATGIAVQEDGLANLQDVRIVGIEGPGLYASSGALSCAGCTVDDVTFAGAALNGGMFLLTDTAIGPVAADAAVGGGVGVYAYPMGTVSLQLNRVTVAPSVLAGVYLTGAGTWLILDSVIEGGPQVDLTSTVSGMGHALMAVDGVGAWDGDAGLRLDGTELRSAQGSGLFLHDSSAGLDGVTFTDNAQDVTVQGCVDQPAPTGIPEDATVVSCPTYDDEFERLVFSLYVDAGEVEE